MKPRQLYRIIAGVAGLFMLYACNQIVVMAVAPFMLVNILNAALVAASYYFIMIRWEERVSWFDIAFLALVFLTGLNIAMRTKFYLFLGLLHCAFMLYLLFRRADVSKGLRILLGFETAMALGSFITMGLIIYNVMIMYLLLAVTIALCGLQAGVFIVMRKNGLMTGQGG